MPHFRNRLLSLISDEALTALSPSIVPIAMREKIDDAQHSGSVYFIEDGVASVVADVDTKMSIELGIIGYEGVTGVHMLYDDPVNVFSTVMQVEGRAAAVDAGKWQALLKRDEQARSVAARFARAFSIQVASTALANGRSKLDERLARWLLMVCDRTGTTFGITHEFISVMLGVRRTGVTLAIQLLEGNSLIRASRGSITIVDRPGLVAKANGAYGFAEAHYDRLLGAPK